MSTVALFKKGVRKLAPVISLTIAAAISEGCQNPRPEIQGTSKNIPIEARPVSISADLIVLRTWLRSTQAGDGKFVFGKNQPVRGVLDVEKNAMGWLDASGQLVEAPDMALAEQLIRGGKVKEEGSLSVRYQGQDTAKVRVLREEYTQVAGCWHPALCEAMVTLVRGAPRDPAAGPIASEYEGPEQPYLPDSVETSSAKARKQ